MSQAIRKSPKPMLDKRADLLGLLAQEAAAFSYAYRRWLDSKCEGLSYLSVRVLETLDCEGPSKMRSVGDYLGLSPRNMTALIDSLEDEGLVVRRSHPDDRRAFLVELTAKGQEIATEVFKRRVTAIGELFEDLSVKQQEVFLESLSVLREGLRRRGLRV